MNFRKIPNSDIATVSRLASRRGRRWLLPLCSVAWMALTIAGVAALWRTENVPGARLQVPAMWPVQSEIARTPGLSDLVVFAHPKCPCTQASVDELADVAARYAGRVHLHFVFYKPSGAADDWAHTDLWASAAAIPGADVRADEASVEAARFGATTSGFVALYDATGHLEFNGGITAERGHAGDNNGVDSIKAILAGQTPQVRTMPVLGCSFLGPKIKCVVPAAGGRAL